MELHERLAPVRTDAPVTTVDPFAAVKDRIHHAIIEDLGHQIFDSEIEPAELRARVTAEIATRLSQESGIAHDDRASVAGQIADDILGHGPLERLLEDDSITEIMVNGPYDVWIERRGKLTPTPVRFHDESHLRRIINKTVAEVGRRVDESMPMVDARLPDGSRVNVIIPPLSLSGALVTIRKFSRQRWNLADLTRMGTLSPETMEFLRLCVQAELNVLVSGGTGSGKTTLLNALSTEIPEDDRIVTIEDSAEMRLNQRHVLRLECRTQNIEGAGVITVRDLVRNALRMRPDRIIVGEVRGAEALDMLQAMNTGHEGSLCTLHANSPRDALARLETMVLMAGYDLPLRAIRQQICAAIDLVVHLERLLDGSRRVTSIVEVERMESDVIGTQPLFEFEVDAVTNKRVVVGGLRSTNLRPQFLDKFDKRGIELPAALFQSPAGQRDAARGHASRGRTGSRS